MNKLIQLSARLSVAALLVALGLTAPAQAHGQHQAEKLKQGYQAEGDAFFVPLYWLPETRQTVVKHIPDHQNWAGFEKEWWSQIPEAEKLSVLGELGAEFDRLDNTKLATTWKRIHTWKQIRQQLALLAISLDQDEGFLDLAHADPALTPAFQWIIDRRRSDFDRKHIGSTFSSAEMAAFYPHLTGYLLDMDEAKRLACFSRLFSKIAEIKAAKGQ